MRQKPKRELPMNGRPREIPAVLVRMVTENTRVAVAEMEFVACTEQYWEFVRTLRTDPRTSRGFIQQTPITPEQHRKYMAAHWREYFIALVDGRPAGFVGSVDDDIRVCTHPDFQGRGVGSFMIGELSKMIPTATAKVKIDNEASKALFRASGFVPTFIIYERPSAESLSTDGSR